jgi:hypothetical protein
MIVYGDKCSVYDLRISSYTVTDIYDRNTITCFMAKYGRMRSVFGMYMVVYGTVYDRKRPFTESIMVDLGTEVRILFLYFSVSRRLKQTSLLRRMNMFKGKGRWSAECWMRMGWRLTRLRRLIQVLKLWPVCYYKII